MKRLLKQGLCFLLVAVVLCGLVGCAKKQNHTPYSVCQEILSLCSDEISWTSLGREQASAYYGLSNHLLENFAAYISDDDAHYDAIAAFTFKNREEKEELAQCYKEVLSSSKATVGLVNNTESSKIQNSMVFELDNLLILIAVENVKQVSEELQKMGAKKYNF